ncbi:MAG TPA: CBS domain-containing protein [Vicinamibacteria bacterium]|jgi:CBS domain-containing protein
MSIEEHEEERRYREAAREEGRQGLFHASVLSLKPRPAVVVTPEESVAAAVARMVAAGQGCVLVTGDGGRVAGIFTERDLLVRVVAKSLDPARTPIRSVMTPDPECLRLDDTLGYALHKMTVGQYRSVPVADEDGRPVGVLTQQEGVKALASLFPAAVFNQPPRSFEQKPPRHRYGG